MKCVCRGTDAEHYEADVADVVLVQGCDVFFALGAGLHDGFAERVEHFARPRAGDPKCVRLAGSLPARLLPAVPRDELEADAWLGKEQASAMAGLVRDKLAEIDRGARRRVPRQRLGVHGRTGRRLSQSALGNKHGSLGRAAAERDRSCQPDCYSGPLVSLKVGM